MHLIYYTPSGVQVTDSDIRRSVTRLPVFKEMLDAVRIVAKAGASQAIVSDANTVNTERWTRFLLPENPSFCFLLPSSCFKSSESPPSGVRSHPLHPSTYLTSCTKITEYLLVPSPVDTPWVGVYCFNPGYAHDNHKPLLMLKAWITCRTTN